MVAADGSSGADAALEWAIEEARHTGRRVLAVHVASFGETMALAPLTLVGLPDATSYGNEVLGRAAEHCRRAGVAATTLLLEGRPADHLVQVSDGAAMLVLGARGLGHAASVLLGSVSHDCAQRARCPVVVVKPPAAGGTAQVPAANQTIRG